MKIPLSPPNGSELFSQGAEEILKVLTSDVSVAPTGKYLHWDKLIHLPPPNGLTNKQWWFAIKHARKNSYRPLPIVGTNKKQFVYLLTDSILEGTLGIDSRASGRIAAPEQVANEDSRDRFLISSLIEESITSSQLEGASTTRQIAVEMLRENRKPRDKSEKMILNNFIAMQKIIHLRDRPMSIDLLLELHATLTEDTLDDPDAAGRFQLPNEERVRVVDHSNGQTLHTPPPAKDIESRIEKLIQFANDEIKQTSFIHPIVKAIILHFWLGYEHPFVDGNGRVARALFYWSAARSGYWLLEFISISRIIKQASLRYSKSFLYVETDDNDLTYFIIDQIVIINRALDTLERYLKRKSDQISSVTKILHGNSALNYRQIALLSHAIRHPMHQYTIRSHQTSHRVAYGTARNDLLNLVDLGFLRQQNIDKKTYAFVAQDNIEQLLKQGGE